MTATPRDAVQVPPTDSRWLIIGPRPLPLRLLLAELWRSRPVLLALGRQEFFVRYRRAIFGALWAVALPLIQALVLALIFTLIVRFKTGPDYPVFIFSGMTAWTFFAGTFAGASTSIVDGSGMASRIYFPRAVFPLIKVVSSLYGFVVALVLLVALTLFFDHGLSLAVFWLLPATGLLVLFTTGISLLVSGLHVYFRDLRFAVQAATTVWFYATPIFYPLSGLPSLARRLILVNPMTGVVELFRLATVGVHTGAHVSRGADPFWGEAALISLAWGIALLVAGIAMQHRYDRLFSDLL